MKNKKIKWYCHACGKNNEVEGSYTNEGIAQLRESIAKSHKDISPDCQRPDCNSIVYYPYAD